MCLYYVKYIICFQNYVMYILLSVLFLGINGNLQLKEWCQDDSGNDPCHAFCETFNNDYEAMSIICVNNYPSDILIRIRNIFDPI